MYAISGTFVFEESPPQRKFSTGHFLIRKMFLEYTVTIPDDEVKQEQLYRRNKLKVLHFRNKNKVGRKGRKPESKAPLMRAFTCITHVNRWTKKTKVCCVEYYDYNYSTAKRLERTPSSRIQYILYKVWINSFNVNRVL